MPYEDFNGTAEDILKRFIATMRPPGTPEFEQMKITMQVRSISGLVSSLDALHRSVIKSTESSDKLSTRVFWLNVVIAVATVAGVIISLLSYIYKSPH